LGNIDKVVVIDQNNGGAAGNGGGGISRLASAGPSVAFGLLQQLEALGLNLPAVMEQLGIKHGGNGSTPPETPVKPGA
jgi:hypothetical protein